MAERALELLKGLLQAAAADPSPLRLALAVCLVALPPLSVVVPMTAVCLLAATILPLPAVVPVLLGGLLLNTALAYGLAKGLGAGRLQGWMEKKGGALGFLRDSARERPFQAAFLSRFVPAPFILAPMVAAAAGLPLRHMLLGTLVAMTPWTLAYAFLARAGRQASLGSIGLGLGFLALAIGMGAYMRRKAAGPPKGRGR